MTKIGIWKMSPVSDTVITPQQLAGQPAKVDPLAPSKLDQEIRQKVTQQFKDSQEKQAQARQDEEIDKKVLEKFDAAAKNFGFVTKKDMESLTQQNLQMVNSIAELQKEIQSLREGAPPARGQNSGMLDDSPQKEKPNPLIRDWKKRSFSER